jgi:acyl-CoA thioester hydrolase
MGFPDRITAGIRVVHLGATSVRYELALFRNDDKTAAAQGMFVHVYVERASRRPMPLPGAMRALLLEIAA